MDTRTIIYNPATRLAKVNLLLVDNDQNMIDMMHEALKSLGFTNIYTANDGPGAADILRKNKIDLVITDWELRPASAENTDAPTKETVSLSPGDGARLVKYIRNSKNSPNPFTSVIMLTGLGLRQNIEYARDAGVNEILLKPVTAQDLCSRIGMVIDDKRPFITSDAYKGPCRRRRETKDFDGADRRKHEIRVFKNRA